MGVESGTYVNDFDTSLPTATDLRSQGDDHLRLIKTFLKNTFTGATRAFQIPATLAKTANYTVLKTDGESTIYVSTGAGACTMTLPTLVALDAGWKVHFVKTNSGANPIFITPPSGTINSGGIAGLSTCRRSIPGVRITAVWDGTAFFVTRAHSLPIGSLLKTTQAALPAGFEWPNGQTLASASANYPEYNSVNGSGTTLDMRGRIGITLDNLGGSSAGRLAGGIITGTAINNTGGTDTVTLILATIPTGITSNNASQSITVNSTSGFQNHAPDEGSGISTGGTTKFGFLAVYNNAIVTSTGSNSISVTSNNTSGGAHSNLQPSIMVAELLVVE